MILIIGSKTDPHVTAVTAALGENGSDFFVLDSFSESSDGLSLRIADNCFLVVEGKEHSIDNIRSVWWRQKPREIVPANSASDLYEYYFEAGEWRTIHKFLENSLAQKYTINPNFTNNIAGNKLHQLKAARESGLVTPRTLVTNSPDAARGFIQHVGGKAIFKTLNAYMNPVGSLTYTTPVDADTVTQFERSLKFGPGIFQEQIAKSFELRVTVIEDDVFVAGINSRYSESSVIDWRQEIFSDIYFNHSINDDLKAAILVLHRRLGLVYGAYDFIIDRDGNPIFLEVNPSGQWLWLERQLDLPIAATLASKLAAR